MDGDQVGRDLRRRAAVLAGDDLAWREWYDDAAPGLRAYVHWRCAGWHDLADEIVQETWLTAVRRVREFDPRRGRFSPLVCGLAAHLVPHHPPRRPPLSRRGPVFGGDVPAPAGGPS